MQLLVCSLRLCMSLRHAQVYEKLYVTKWNYTYGSLKIARNKFSSKTQMCLKIFLKEAPYCSILVSVFGWSLTGGSTALAYSKKLWSQIADRARLQGVKYIIFNTRKRFLTSVSKDLELDCPSISSIHFSFSTFLVSHFYITMYFKI